MHNILIEHHFMGIVLVRIKKILSRLLLNVLPSPIKTKTKIKKREKKIKKYKRQEACYDQHMFHLEVHLYLSLYFPHLVSTFHFCFKWRSFPLEQKQIHMRVFFEKMINWKKENKFKTIIYSTHPKKRRKKVNEGSMWSYFEKYYDKIKWMKEATNQNQTLDDFIGHSMFSK